MTLRDVLDEIYDRVYQYEARMFDRTLEYFERLHKVNELGMTKVECNDPEDDTKKPDPEAVMKAFEEARKEFDEAWRSYREAIEELCAFTTSFLRRFKPPLWS